MCGICGICLSDSNTKTLDENTVLRMRDVLHHRGPDDSGLFVDGHVGLGHRRLTIVDLVTGQQPITNSDRSIFLIFNGEIYNHESYRSKLADLGHKFSTTSDTEIIIHLYEEFGEDCVDYLDGMFAFAIWDTRRRRLFMARDRLGIKPLYYHVTSDGSLLFGSEIKSLLASGWLTPQLNFTALPDLLANQAPSGEHTLYAGIQRLPAGHTLSWQNNGITIQQYWDVEPPDSSSDNTILDNQYIEKWRDCFQQAVSSHLMADVPVGVLLSGGIDSTAIAAMMRSSSKDRLSSFSVAFAEKQANELKYARVAANALNTDHHEVLVSSTEYFTLLPKLIWQEDEPIAHVASVPLYVVCDLAAKHVKVVLTGEGADELMAGYSKYKKTIYNLAIGKRFQRIVPRTLQDLIKFIANRFPHQPSQRKLRRTFLCREANVANLYFDNFSVFTKEDQRSLYSSNATGKIHSMDPYTHHADYYEKFAGHSTLSRLLYVDLKIYLQELLMKQDQMSMAASIESRVPFLDRNLVSLTSKLPDRMKLRGLNSKYILRQAMRDQIPSMILNRPKMGFPVPVGDWLRQKHKNLLDEFVLSERFDQRNIFNRLEIQNIVDNHLSGRHDNAQKLWTLLNLEIWMRQALDGETVDSTTDTIRALSA